eukprot:15464947-Alexandrium_andersonii.AAC.1
MARACAARQGRALPSMWGRGRALPSMFCFGWGDRGAAVRIQSACVSTWALSGMLQAGSPARVGARGIRIRFVLGLNWLVSVPGR